MPVAHLTVRLLDKKHRRVLAVKRQPFVVLDDGEDTEQVLRELEDALAAAENEIAELEKARHDPHHHLHRRFWFWQEEWDVEE